MKRVALYARVSTANGQQDPQVQVRELKEYAWHRGWEIVGEYIDNGVSGTKSSRPELNRLMADGHRRRFEIVAVWRFDRFAKSVSHLLRALETFQALGVDLISLSENVDTSTPTGKIVFTVLGAVAELERCLIVERVNVVCGMLGRRARHSARGGELLFGDVGEGLRRLVGDLACDHRNHVLRQAEVENLGVAAFRDENVCGFDIAMNDAFAVSRVEGIGNLDVNRDNALRIEGAGGDNLVRDPNAFLGARQQQNPEGLGCGRTGARDDSTPDQCVHPGVLASDRLLHDPG